MNSIRPLIAAATIALPLCAGTCKNSSSSPDNQVGVAAPEKQLGSATPETRASTAVTSTKNNVRNMIFPGSTAPAITDICVPKGATMGSTIRDAAKKAAESCDGGLHSYTAAEKACTSAGGRMDHMMHIVDSKADAGNTKNACTELKVSIQSGCLEGQYSNLISVASKCGTKVGVAERNGVPYWTCAD